MAHDDRGNQHQNSRFYITDGTGEIKAKKTMARSPVLVEQSSPVAIAKYEMPYIQKET